MIAVQLISYFFSIEEIRALREAHAQFQASLTSAQADFEALAQLDQQIKSCNVGPNPYTWFTMEALEDTWKNLQKIIKVVVFRVFNLHNSTTKLFELTDFYWHLLFYYFYYRE